MNRIWFIVGCWSGILVLTILGGSAYAQGARGGGMGLFVLGGEITGGASAFRSLGWPIASQGAFLLDFEVTMSGRRHLLGLSSYVGSQLQYRIGRLHVGFGPGLLAGGWLFAPDADCEDNDECIGGAVGTLGFALAGETGYTLSQTDARRLDLIVRALGSRGKLTTSNEIQIWQIYLGIRISQ